MSLEILQWQPHDLVEQIADKDNAQAEVKPAENIAARDIAQQIAYEKGYLYRKESDDISGIPCQYSIVDNRLVKIGEHP